MKALTKIVAGMMTVSISASTFTLKPSNAEAVSLLNAQNVLLNMSSEDQLASSEIASRLGFDSAIYLIQEVMANAYSYDPTNIYDLSGDGKLTVQDALVVLDFLEGISQYAYDYSEMDGDGDGKIDLNDCYAYMAYAGDVSSHLITDKCITTHMPRSYTPETLTFRKYNAATGAFKSTYTLAPLAATNNNQTDIFSESNSDSLTGINPTALSSISSTNSVDMIDEGKIIYRGKQSSNVYPAGIVKIQTYTGTNFVKRALSSGFVIDSHTIATAAHVVYNRDLATSQNCYVKNNKMIIFSQNGTALEDLTITPVEYHVPEKFMQNPYKDGYDFALITVKEDLSDYVSLSLGLPLDKFIESGTTVYNTGTPSLIIEDDGEETIVNDNITHTIVTAKGSVFNFDSNDPLNMIIGANCPIPASGNPMYAPDNGAVLGIGVAGAGTHGETLGSTAIRSEMFQFFYNNPYIVY